MQALSIIWRVLVNLAETAVILAMFHITTSSFETVVVSALVLIYVSVVGSFSFLAYALFKKGQQDMARFIEIAKLLKQSNTEIYEEVHKEDQEGFQKVQAGIWINAGFRTLFALIAIGNLVNAVV